jgi:hypothetical protein
MARIYASMRTVLSAVADLDRHYPNQYQISKEPCSNGCGYIQDMTRWRITWRDVSAGISPSCMSGKFTWRYQGAEENGPLSNKGDQITKHNHFVADSYRRSWLFRSPDNPFVGHSGSGGWNEFGRLNRSTSLMGINWEELGNFFYADVSIAWCSGRVLGCQVLWRMWWRAPRLLSVVDSSCGSA